MNDTTKDFVVETTRHQDRLCTFCGTTIRAGAVHIEYAMAPDTVQKEYLCSDDCLRGFLLPAGAK